MHRWEAASDEDVLAAVCRALSIPAPEDGPGFAHVYEECLALLNRVKIARFRAEKVNTKG